MKERELGSDFVPHLIGTRPSVELSYRACRGTTDRKATSVHPPLESTEQSLWLDDLLARDGDGVFELVLLDPVSSSPLTLPPQRIGNVWVDDVS